MVVSMVVGLSDADAAPWLGIGSGAAVPCIARVSAFAGLILGGMGRSPDMCFVHSSVASSQVMLIGPAGARAG